ncbi:MAG: hypothetical protein ABIT10_04080 [Alteraurantiacibacter sp.]
MIGSSTIPAIQAPFAEAPHRLPTTLLTATMSITRTRIERNNMRLLPAAFAGGLLPSNNQRH